MRTAIACGKTQQEETWRQERYGRVFQTGTFVVASAVPYSAPTVHALLVQSTYTSTLGVCWGHLAMSLLLHALLRQEWVMWARW